MTTLLVSVTAILVLAGVGIALWSILNTRKKYFKEYTERKKND